MLFTTVVPPVITAPLRTSRAQKCDPDTMEQGDHTIEPRRGFGSDTRCTRGRRLGSRCGAKALCLPEHVRSMGRGPTKELP